MPRTQRVRSEGLIASRALKGRAVLDDASLYLILAISQAGIRIIVKNLLIPTLTFNLVE